MRPGSMVGREAGSWCKVCQIVREGLRLIDLWVWGSGEMRRRSGWRNCLEKMQVEEHKVLLVEEKLSMPVWL